MQLAFGPSGDMANQKVLTDEYVAGLLAKDATESSLKYSTVGLKDFAASKPPANKPKPNTRFLRNIIKETDSHNVALLAKEAAESQARLQSLSRKDRHKGKESALGGSDVRKRQLGDIAAILGGKPSKIKRKTEDLQKASKESTVGTAVGDNDEPGQSRREKRKKRKREDDHTEDSKYSRGLQSHQSKRRSKSEDRGNEDNGRRRRHRSRSRSPKERKSHESRHRRRSPRRERSKSPVSAAGKGKTHHRHYHRSSPLIETRDSKEHTKSVKTLKPEPDYDSDPLDEIIGPRPAATPVVKSRGRGATSLASGIDSRFSSNYDPAEDVHLDCDEENDWDQALEALRDRQRWNQRGADRLRAAGFTEDEIAKWKKGGEKGEEDVQWTKAGEDREWDRGKVVGDDGHTFVESQWGRLKGT